MTYPVASVVRPTDLAQASNGNLADSALVDIVLPGHPTGARLHRYAALAFQKMAAEVKTRFDVDLTCTSVADCYRSYDRQVRTFTSRYQTTKIDGRPVKVWKGVTYWQKPGTAMAAVPGTSNHGWGLAIDVGIFRPSLAVIGITSRSDVFGWLLVNARKYGFSWEAQSEPWHIRYVNGDPPPPPPVKPPAPVVPPPAPPTPDEEEHNVLQGLWQFKGHSAVYALYTGGYKVWQLDPGMLSATQALMRLGGKNDAINVMDNRDMFRAFGPILGPTPMGVDAWGAIP